MRAGQREYRVVVQSRDRQPFRITRIECTVPGIQGRSTVSTAAMTQILQVEGVPRAKDRRGAIRVFTDHPVQQNLDVPLVFID